MSSADEILAGYADLQAGQEAFYKDLHEHPELSHHEHRTAQRVAGKLQEYDFTVHAGIGGTGVAGVLATRMTQTMTVAPLRLATWTRRTDTRQPRARSATWWK